MLAALASLVKPRIVALLTLTGLGGLFAAGGAPPATVVAFLVAGATIAAGSAALNCYYDRDLDRTMARTADRPLPSGDLSARAALAFAAALVVVGSTVALATLPLASAIYMWAGLLAYLGLYTVALKRRHPAGVVLGGSAGSFPVLAGWTAVAPLEPVAMAMAALVFVWTPAHAWALAHVYRDDFVRAGVATLPAVASTPAVARAVWVSALLTALVGFVVALAAGPVYLGAVAVASPLFVLAMGRFRRAPGDPSAVAAFFASNTYLAVLFLAWGAGGVLSPAFVPGVVAGALLACLAFAWLAKGAPTLRGVPAPPYPLARLWRRDPSADPVDGTARRPATDGGPREGDA